MKRPNPMPMVAIGLFAVLAPFANAQADFHLPGLRSSPPLNRTWRMGVHNAYWHGAYLGEALASGPIQHLLDSAFIDRARSFELDLHVGELGTSPNEFAVFHTNIPGYSLCRELGSCLDVFRAFHFANPKHDPVFINLELKNLGSSVWSYNLKPKDLDNLLKGKLNHFGSWIFTPLDYLNWCQAKRFPSKTTPPDTDLRAAVAACGWPTVDELRGKFLVTIHGNFDKREYDVYDYSHSYGNGIYDSQAFPMAGAIGKGGDFLGIRINECSDEGNPNEAHSGNVCDWNSHSVFVDYLQPNKDEYPFTSPFFPVPTVAAQLFKNMNMMFRSRDANSAKDVDEARRTMYGTSTGFNIITGDAPRNHPYNRLQSYRPPISSGCLWINDQPPADCNDNDVTEPNSTIEMRGVAPSIKPGVEIGRTSDDIRAVFKSVPTGYSVDFRAFISTHTDEQQFYGDSYTGRFGCLMARTDNAPDSPFLGVCRYRSKLYWDPARWGQQGIWVLARPKRGAATIARFMEHGNFPDDPKGNGSGIPELDPFVQMLGSADHKFWIVYKRATDDPTVNHKVEIRDTRNGMDAAWGFEEPLNLIGLAMDGGALTELGLHGIFTFHNVRLNSTYLKLTDFDNEMNPVSKFPSVVVDRSSLNGLCAADLSGQIYQITGSGFSRTGFGQNAQYTQRVTITNSFTQDIPGPLTLQLVGLNIPQGGLVNQGITSVTCQTPTSLGVSVPLNGGVLKKGESVTVNLFFANPNNVQISYTPRVVGMGKLRAD